MTVITDPVTSHFHDVSGSYQLWVSKDVRPMVNFYHQYPFQEGSIALFGLPFPLKPRDWISKVTNGFQWPAWPGLLSKQNVSSLCFQRESAQCFLKGVMMKREASRTTEGLAKPSNARDYWKSKERNWKETWKSRRVNSHHLPLRAAPNFTSHFCLQKVLSERGQVLSVGMGQRYLHSLQPHTSPL